MAFQKPLSPSQPSQSDVEAMVSGLLQPGAKPAARATEWLVSNPNLGRREQLGYLDNRLSQARSPQEAAEAVLEATFDRMVAANYSSQE